MLLVSPNKHRDGVPDAFNELDACINFSTTAIKKQIHAFWIFLSTTVHMIRIISSLIFYIFSKFLSSRKSMDKKTRFPILRLDYVAIREVLKVLDPIDHINFSEASKACRRLSTIKTPYKVELSIMDHPRAMFKNGPITYDLTWSDDKDKDGTRRIEKWANKSHEYLFMYSEHPLNAMKKFYLDARSLMGVEVSSVVFNMDHANSRGIVDWLRLNLSGFEALRVFGKNQRQEDLEYILDNLKCEGSLKINVDTIQRYPLEIPNTLEELDIRYASWITLDYLMSLKMSRLAFNGTHVTNQDINVFYKSWMKMDSHQNLEFFEIDLRIPEEFLAVGLKDIPYRMGPMRPGLDPSYTPMEGSFEVTRKDGLKASICVYHHLLGFTMILYTQLLFLQKN
ncbi:hypothetical protein B9Z55_011591 [Caenorhabditis nigoni]|nr:hypothetical protein B9Z55_011591 [Caenorhabditis nigoni]